MEHQWIGWAAAVVLCLTIGTQTWKQYTARTAKGVSVWLFIGQIAASAGFLAYAALIGDAVFVVTNVLLIASAVVGVGLVFRNRRLDARREEGEGEASREHGLRPPSPRAPSREREGEFGIVAGVTSYAADLDAIREARERIRPHVHETPVMTSETLDRRAGKRLFFKCENLQKGGAFKARGASNAIWKLDDATAARGVVTHSSGNHAQAVAIAARARGIPAHIVMPTDAPRVKRAAVEGYGATVHPCEPTLEARTSTAARVLEETGGTLIPPYDHRDVIAGQGTCALELVEQVPGLDAVIVPVGGGGLITGMTLALREAAPNVRVFAAEPSGADDAARSKESGQRVERHTPNTICDGLKTTLGELTWPVVRDLVEEVLLVDDLLTVPAMKLVFERMKLVVEPSGAVGLAAALASRFRAIDAERVAIVFTGGNVDLDALPWTRPRKR